MPPCHQKYSQSLELVSVWLALARQNILVPKTKRAHFICTHLTFCMHCLISSCIVLKFYRQFSLHTELPFICMHIFCCVDAAFIEGCKTFYSGGIWHFYFAECCIGPYISNSQHLNMASIIVLFLLVTICTANVLWYY